jgi:hypothetical protein
MYYLKSKEVPWDVEQYMRTTEKKEITAREIAKIFGLPAVIRSLLGVDRYKIDNLAIRLIMLNHYISAERKQAEIRKLLNLN